MFWRRCHRAPMSECSSWVLPWWRAARAPSSCWLSCSPAPAVVPALTGSALSQPSSPSQHQTIRISPKVSLLLVRLKGLSSGSDKEQSRWRDTCGKAGGRWHHTTKPAFSVSGTHRRAQDGTDRGFVLHHSAKNEHFVERSRTRS